MVQKKIDLGWVECDMAVQDIYNLYDYCEHTWSSVFSG
jgi:hypothetical protein